MMESMDYHIAKKRGRPKGSKNKVKDEVIDIRFNEKQNLESQVETLRKKVEELTAQLTKTDSVLTKKEEECTPLDLQKLKSGVLLNTNQREKLQREVKGYERILSMSEEKLNNLGKYGNSGVYNRYDILDRSEVMMKMQKAKKSLEGGTIGRLSAKDINILNARKKELESEIRRVMPSLSDRNSSDDHKTNEIANWLVENKSKIDSMQFELQNIRKALNQDNPDAGNLTGIYKK